jgi:phosphatidylethanolamine-binding protein (PEBP) family uncharacterized protein
MPRLNVTTRIGRAFRFLRASDGRLAWRKLAQHLAPTLDVSSPDFASGEELPRSATAHGMGDPPVLVVRNVPPNAKSVAVICESADSPTLEPFVHWLLYRLPGHDLTIDSDAIATAHEGKNSKLQIGWAPVNPPHGHGLHHYHFQVFALDTSMPGTPQDTALPVEAYWPSTGVEAGAGRRELVESMRGHVLAWGEIVGTYEQP